jgi:hypothetical protein
MLTRLWAEKCGIRLQAWKRGISTNFHTDCTAHPILSSMGADVLVEVK